VAESVPGLTALDRDEIVRDWRARAPAWARWAAHIEKLAEKFNEPLLDAADLEPGQRVLDLACGAGEPALSAARRVAPDGLVTATDLLPEMLVACRERAGAAGIANIDFRVADMAALPFNDRSFERVICRFGIMFVPDPVAAMLEARRVLVAQGKSAWMVWGPLDDNTLQSVLQHEARAALSLPADPDLPQFRFARSGLIANVLNAAGFTDVTEQELRFKPAPKHGSRFWQANLEMSFARDLADLPAARRQALDDRLEAAFDRFRVGDHYLLRAHLRIATGRAPARK